MREVCCIDKLEPKTEEFKTMCIIIRQSVALNRHSSVEIFALPHGYARNWILSSLVIQLQNSKECLQVNQIVPLPVPIPMFREENESPKNNQEVNYWHLCSYYLLDPLYILGIPYEQRNIKTVHALMTYIVAGRTDLSRQQFRPGAKLYHPAPRPWLEPLYPVIRHLVYIKI